MRSQALQGRWLGAMLVAMLGGGASAEECPTPTLEVCTQEGYAFSDCGVQHKETCNELIAKAFDAEWQQLENGRIALLPEELGGHLSYVREMPIETGEHVAEGGENTFAGTLTKNQLLHRKGFENLNDSDMLQLEALKQWEDNSELVGSCQEFAYEQAYDYSKFEDQLGALHTNHRAIFEAAYAPEGIAWRELVSRSGEPLAPIFTQEPVEKNAYFRFEPGPYPDSAQERFEFEPELVKLVQPEGREYYPASFDWHMEMNQMMEGIHDDELNELYAEQMSFAALVKRRQGLWDFYTNAKEQGAEGLEEIEQELSAELYSIDAALQEGLMRAREKGCLDLGGVSLCDWSPMRFQAEVKERMLTRREKDYQNCLLATTLDEELSQGFLLPALELNERIIEILKRWMEDQGQHHPATCTGMGTERSGGERWGNDNFAAGYAYAAGWRLSCDQACQAGLRLHASFTADATLFRNNFEVLHANAEANIPAGSPVRIQALVRVVGSDIYNHDSSFQPRWSISGNPNTSKKEEVTARVMVGPIPVSVAAGLSGSLGLSYNLTAEATRNCEKNSVHLNTTGQIKPWAQLDGFASAAVDLWAVSAGVRGYLTLLRADLPLTGAVDLATIFSTSGSPTVQLSAATRLELELSSLNGRIAVFARENLFGNEVEATLVSWNGVQYKTTLFQENFTRTLW